MILFKLFKLFWLEFQLEKQPMTWNEYNLNKCNYKKIKTNEEKFDQSEYVNSLCQKSPNSIQFSIIQKLSKPFFTFLKNIKVLSEAIFIHRIIETHVISSVKKVYLSRVRIKKKKESHYISVKIYVKKASVLQLLEHLDYLPIYCLVGYGVNFF